MIPIVSLLPVVNSQQKIVALIPSFESANDEQNLQLLEAYTQINFLERLSSILLVFQFDDPNSAPIEFEQGTSSKNLVFCFREDQCQTAEAQAKLDKLLSLGIRVMVDNFNSKSSLVWPGTKGIIVDCREEIPLHVQGWLLTLQQHQHLAKHVSTSERQLDALDAGFSLFCGDFAFSVSNRSNASDPTTRARLLKLLGLVSRDADAKELEGLFKQDPALSFMLFKIVSSAAFAQTIKVSSFIQAINLLGRRQLQRWLQLLLYARQTDQGTALNPLMLRAAFRASLMEAFCRQHGGSRDHQDCAFMVGMFSLLDLLFGCPLWEVLKPLSLPDEVRDALIDRGGELGHFLMLVELADRENTGALKSALRNCEVDIETYNENMIYAYSWVNQICQDL